MAKKPFVAYEGIEPYVFICYAHEDADFVYPEILKLHEYGFHIWYDEGIAPGAEWPESLADKIEGSSVFLYYESPRSVASDHCRREVNFALDQSCEVLPVCVEPAEIPKGLQLSLGNRQTIFRYELDREAYEEKLFSAIQQVVAPRSDHPIKPRVESHETQTPASRRIRIGTSMVAILVAIAALAWFLVPQQSDTDPFEPIRSIAVLPLENLSGDPDQQYFADGMSATLIGDLGKIRALHVISRRSVLRYQDTNKSLPEIARELNVDAIIEGSVIRAGDRVRINVELIDARTDRQLWSDRYEGELSDVLALQSQVALAVAEQVRIELTPEEQTALAASHAVDPQAYDAYLRGLQILTSEPAMAVGGWGPRAIEHLERAVALDPDFASAWASLAGARLRLGIVGLSTTDRSEFPKAKDAVQRALEIDDQLGAAHALLGLIRLYHDWDIAGARRAYENAIALSPGDPRVLSGYAMFLWKADGRIDDALNMSARALRLAPFDLSLRQERLWILYQARQYEKGLEEVEQARMLNAHFATQTAANLYVVLGRIKEARDAQSAFWEQCGTQCDWQRDPIERLWARGGGPEDSYRLFLETLDNLEAVPPWVVATMYSEIGETDPAIDWLERGVQERDPVLITALRYAPAYDLLRFDPRFQELMRRVMGSSVLDEDPRVLAGVAQTLVRAGRAAEAISHLETAIELYPADASLPRWRYYLSLAHFVAERYDEALEWTGRALQQNGDVHNSAFIHFVRASSFAHLDRLDEARKALNEAVRLWPGPLEIERDLRFIFTIREPALQDRYLDGLRQAGLK